MLTGNKYNELRKQAQDLYSYLNTLKGFTIINKSLSPASEHAGRVIVDAVLQVGKDYEKQVKPAVTRILRFKEAATISGFIALLNSKPLHCIINFKTAGTKSDLLKMANFFAGLGIDSYEDLYNWLESENHRDDLLTENSGVSGVVFKIANKTADYFRVLVRHWDAVAVDSGIRDILSQAKITLRYSKKYTYKELRSILQMSAVFDFKCCPIDLDKSIYEYSRLNKNSNSTQKKSTHSPGRIPFKYCINCGIKISASANYCPECGCNQQ